MFNKVRNKLTGTKSEKQLAKEKKIITLTLMCDSLLSLYPDFEDSIKKMKKKIDDIPHPLKTVEVDALINQFIEFKKNLLIQVGGVNEEKKKEQDRQVALEFAKKEAAKRLELQAKIAELQTKLSSQCSLPRELLESKVAHLLHHKTYDRDFNPDEEKDNFLRKHSVHPYDETSYAIIHLEKDLEKFCSEYLTYIRERALILLAINNIASLDEEERIQQQINAFKKLTTEKFEALKALAFKIDTYQELRQSLKYSERNLPEALFSSIDSPKAEQDIPLLGEDGEYYSKVFLDENKALIARESKEIKQIEDERFRVKRISESSTTPCLEFMHIYSKFKNDRIELLKRINAFTAIADMKLANEEAKQLTQLIAAHDKRIHEINKKLTSHKVVKQKQQEIKNARKLDSQNTSHLLKWELLTEPGIADSGGVRIIFEDRTYHIPTRIHRLMMILNEDHLDVDTLLAALNHARLHRPGLFSNPFSFLLRNSEVQDEYSRPFEVKC